MGRNYKILNNSLGSILKISRQLIIIFILTTIIYIKGTKINYNSFLKAFFNKFIKTIKVKK